MAVYFLADIHLSEQQPEITAAFEQNMHTLVARKPEGIFILGDLFDYYLGDELMSAFQQRIALFLRGLTQHTPIFFQHGNRDFLIKTQFAQQSGLTLLPERYVFYLDDNPVLLEHGDLLCSDDHAYQRMRNILRHPLTYKVYQRIPTRFKHFIARWLRKKSQQAGKTKPAHITDTNVQTVAQIMQQFRVETLIHGHTHRPKIQPVANGTCYVVGDWHPHGTIIAYNNQQFYLLNSNELA